MFTLLNPSALLALLGLLVPVAIHLWNRRPGRKVAVGSLRWLAAGANRRLRNLQPEQLWLLLLRAALLAVLAVAVAGPGWRQRRPAGRGQVLLSPAVAGTPALAAMRPVIDSLRRRGYALRWLAAGFPKISDTSGRAASGALRDMGRGLAGAEAARAADAFSWARAGQAAGVFAGQPLRVLTPAALRGFQGPHPPLPTTLTWQPLPTDSADTWLQAAALRGGDSLRLQIGRSDARQTAFQLMTMARPRLGGLVRVDGLPPLRLLGGGTGGALQLVAVAASADRNPVSVLTKPLRVVLYVTAKYAFDARCLQAGLRAAAVGLPQPLELRLTTSVPTPAARPDWLFWLSEAPVPAAWRAAVRQGTQLWQEAAGPGISAKSRLVGEGSEVPVAIGRRGAARPDLAAGGVPLWADGLGRPVLAKLASGRGAFYQLYTRLGPIWGELAESPALPTRLLALLQPAPTDGAAGLPEPTFDLRFRTHDQRGIDPAQLPFKVSSSTPKVAPPPIVFHLTDLRPWLVLLAGLLFALERGLARRQQARSVSSASSAA